MSVPQPGSPTLTMIVWMVPFWSAPIETVLADLAARPDGLTQIEADRQRLRFGPNRRSDTRKTTPLGLLLNQFRSPLVLLLLFAMTLSLFLGETTDGMIVLAIVLGSALLGFLQEYRASSAVAKLLAVIQTKVTVLRDGHEVELPHDALVPGDVIVLAAGAAVPGRLPDPPFHRPLRGRIHIDGRELPRREGRG